MYEDDLALLRCPKSGQMLALADITERATDGEIIEGTLAADGNTYRIANGIPRFADDVSYNPTWDYKWRVLDAGAAYNYRIIDKNDRAYSIHDIFDRNNHDGHGFRAATDGLALDIGCGIGQYSVKLALEYGPSKVVAVDLTTGVDLFRKILIERYPQLKRKILIVQANVFSLPFANETFDLVMSLGVLMHTGQTLKALDNACKLVKPNGEINVWIYCSEPLAYDSIEPGREAVWNISNVHKFLAIWKWPMFWIRKFRVWNHDFSVKVLRFLSSDFLFKLSRKPYGRWIDRIFQQVDHPEFGYRLINHYDGYVNNWCDTWNEHEVFPVFKNNSIVVLGMSSWRMGIWGKKIPHFFTQPR